VLLPSGALGERLRATLSGDPLAWQPVLVLTVWATVLGAAAVRSFRWH
ncbi:MAG: transporter, partial [Actinotalea sp.]|nr:transporter [Actinotalea sp.]